MTADQHTKTIDVQSLLRDVAACRDGGCRLVQISATRLAEQFELIYSFDDGKALQNLRVHIDPTEPHVPSITGLYWCAFLYENEMHDLFNIGVDGIVVDFKGNLYQTAVKHAFSSLPPAPKAPSPPKKGAPPTAAAPQRNNGEPACSAS